MQFRAKALGLCISSSFALGGISALSSYSAAESSIPGSQVSEVVVVGGGILGCSTAYWLARGGKTVTLLEKSTVGCEASSLAAGTLSSVGLGKDMSWKEQLMHHSMLIYKDLRDKYSLDLDLVCKGSLQVAVNAEEKEVALADYKQLLADGHDVRFLATPEEVASYEPACSGGVAIAAIYSKHGGHIDPSKATHGMAEAATVEGAVVVEGELVVCIEEVSQNPRSYRVKTNKNNWYHCAAVVLCTGSADSMLLKNSFGLECPVIPVKGQIWVTDQEKANTLQHVIFGTGAEVSSYWKTRKEVVPRYTTHPKDKRTFQHVYGRQCADGTILFGGDRIPCADRNLDYQVMDDLVQENYKHIKRILPGIGPMVGSYCCYMPFSLCPFGRPLLGNIFDGIWIAGGFGHFGIATAPMAGKVLAEAICNEATEESLTLLKLFDPTRFDEFQLQRNPNHNHQAIA